VAITETGVMDDSTIEFCCNDRHDLDFNPNDYRLLKVIVYDE
jgi:hypothetical protein